MRGGRSNNNRKAPNPLTRSYESNGPDVKIRGTAHHVGEKYLQLARDAQSSGDPVMAESYLQHAEHYFRLIAAAQQAQQQAAFGYQRQPGDAEAEEFEDDDDFGGIPDRFASPPERFAAAVPQQQPSYAPQPATNAQPYQERPYYNNGNGHNDRPNYERPEQDRSERPPRQDRFQGQDRNFRNDRNFQGQDRNQDRDRNPDRSFQGQDRNQDRGYQGGGQERTYPDRQPYQDRQGQNRDQEPRGNSRGGGRREFREPRPALNPESEASLPAFITAPVRLQPEVHMDSTADEAPARTMMAQPEAEGDVNGGFLLRPRRRRRSKAEMQDLRGETSNASDPVGE
jgi:hypothetical protein